MEFYVIEDYYLEIGMLLGFWFYLMSDCLIFVCLFVIYGVLGCSYVGGFIGVELFDLLLVVINILFLLLLLIIYGFVMLEM